MIGKQIKGAGFRGVLQYMEAKVKEGVGQFLDSNMLSKTAKDLSKEFGIIRSQKPDLKKAVYHCSLAIGKEEKLSDKQFIQLGREYLEKMGFGNSQYVMYRHSDRDHPHVHLIANRIDMEGKVVSDRWDYRRSENAIRELEKKYGLSPVLDSKNSQETSLSKGQVELYRRTGAIPVKKQIQMALRDTMQKAGSINEFEKKLAENGVSIQYHRNKQEKVFGVSFMLENQVFKGSGLGKGYSWTKIDNQLKSNYERNRRSSQEVNRGKEENIESAGRKSSENQYHKHSGTERSFGPNHRGYSKTDHSLTAGNSQPSGTTSQGYHGHSDNGTTASFSGKENIGFEKDEVTSDLKNNGVGTDDRIGIGIGNLSNSVLSDGSMKNDNEEPPKKGKKKKNKGRNRGIGL